MKLKIKKDILLENLNNVSKALSTRNIIPVLNGIKFELKKEGLTLTASDTDLTIQAFIDKKDITELEEEGTLIIIGKYLIEIIRKLPDEVIKIEDLDGSKAIIETNNSKYNLNCFDINDFPAISLEENENPIKLDSLAFKEIINQTSFAASTQESRPILTGINIKLVDNIFECIATDSYRLAKKAVKVPTTLASEVNIVVPSKNVNDLIKIIEEENEELKLSVFNNKVLFKYKNLLFQSSLLNGSYPNTDNLIPKDFEISIEADTNEFYDVIDRASLLTQAKEKNIIQLEIKENNLIITSQSLEIGRVEETMSCNNINNKNLKISFSAKYMLEALRTIKSKNISLLLNGEIKPIILKDKDSSDLTQLILPIKTY